MNQQNKFVFLASQKFETGKAVRGAFLLTDSETKPLEFRCTNPIRPKPLQAMLYGNVLDEYIWVELIGRPLLNTIKGEPSFVIVKEASFLDLRTKIDVPVVQITKLEQASAAVQNNDSNSQVLNSSTGKFGSIIVTTHGKFPEDKNLAKEVLGEIFQGYDLNEPFNRVMTALEQVHMQKIGEV